MRGFTFVEVILVMALTAILGVVAVPLIVPESRAGTFSAARKVVSDLRYAQSLAMSRGVPHGINFVAGQPYVLYRQDPATPVPDPLTQKSFSEDLSRFGDTDVQTTVRVEFDSLGRPTMGAGTGISLVGGPDTKVVTVSPNTGHASYL